VAVDSRNLVGEVGYWVAPWARSQHVAQRATRLLADWAFGQAGFQRLELYIEPDNAASCAVAERLGCEREGLLRGKAIVQGQRRDMALYALVMR
jgi:RimJ/RimL family protein N-acetyltransferase